MTELGVGKALSEARQAQGLTLADVAQQLKFMTRQIESLEAERFESLPGPTIARGMVRTYARFLKIDPEPLLQSMNATVVAPDATPQLAARFSQPVPFSDNGRRSTVLYLALSAAVLAIAGGVVYEWRHERKAPLAVAAVPVPAPAAAAPAPAPAPKPEVPAAKPKPPPEEKIAEPVVLAPKPEPVAPPPPQAAPTPPAVKEPPPPQVASADPGTPKPAGGANRLILRFEQDAWAEVTDAAGRNLISSLNNAGTERVIRGAPPFTLVIGNAQHVKVIYNNREIDMQPYVKVEVARFTLK